MTTSLEPMTLVSLKIRVNSNAKAKLADWHAQLNHAITAFPGFVSLEVLVSPEGQYTNWTIVQRFCSPADASAWRDSNECQELMEELKKLLAGETPQTIQELASDKSHLREGVTEVFVTQVSPHKEEAYRTWISKIHQAEAKFPGFRGVYVQAPSQSQGDNWITLLQFDTPENLDHWLSSSERQHILDESKDLITSLERHRVVSSYAGWFDSISKNGRPPPAWKQTMIVLLVLFPIVMLEFKFLIPLLKGLNPSIGTFISNAISVCLIAWPATPLAVSFLRWWLDPNADQRTTILGTFLVIGLYLLSILIFWT